MTRKKKLARNSISSMVYQIVSIICNLILPYYFLTYYGSVVNGLVISIMQFLGFISLCELGIGAVVQSALYKPLAEHDYIKISQIYVSAEKLFHKVAQILCLYVLVLVVVFPMLKQGTFDVAYIRVLIIIISVSLFAQYYFGITNQIVLNADQRAYVQLVTQIVILIFNTITSVIIMKMGASVHIVQLSTTLIFLIRPIVFSYYVKRHYSLDKSIEFTEEPIKQKWNGIAQHFANVVLTYTPTAVLTVFSTFENVSVYSVYYLVVHGVRQIVVSLTNGLQALLGNMLARKEKRLEQVFSSIEWVLHTLTTLAFSITVILIMPFVEIYTKNIHDVNYYVPLAAMILTFAQAVYCLRVPYQMMVFASGHFKQTQRSSIIEAIMNIIISIILVFYYNIGGVAIGMLIAVLYRTTYFAWYLSKNILHRNFIHFTKHMILDCLLVALAIYSTKFIQLGSLNFISWVLMAVKVGLICFMEVIIVNVLLYRRDIETIRSILLNKSFNTIIND